MVPKTDVDVMIIIMVHNNEYAEVEHNDEIKLHFVWNKVIVIVVIIIIDLFSVGPFWH